MVKAEIPAPIADHEPACRSARRDVGLAVAGAPFPRKNGAPTQIRNGIRAIHQKNRCSTLCSGITLAKGQIRKSIPRVSLSA